MTHWDKNDRQTLTDHKHHWYFGQVSAATLLPKLEKHLLTKDETALWQLVWLNNNGQAVIGLLPKVSWSVHVDSAVYADTSMPMPNPSPSPSPQPPRYHIVKTYRDNRPKAMADDYVYTDDYSHVTVKNMSYDEWQNELIRYSEDHNRDEVTLLEDNLVPYYSHGLMGFIGYDISACELSPHHPICHAEQPCAVLGHYDIYLAADAQAGWILHLKPTDSTINQTSLKKSTLIANLITYLDELDIQLSTIEQSKAPLTPLILKAYWQKRDYEQAFERTQYYLQAGDCYQINLTQAWHSQRLDSALKVKNERCLIDYLPALQHDTKAPFGGYLSINTLSINTLSTTPSNMKHADSESLASNKDKIVNTFELLSCSPELFFTFYNKGNGQHYIRTKPIKGTLPRGSTPEQDKALKQQLSDSLKDRAENVMIVDLLRNDLGKYAKIGSVKVPQLFAIESFSNVHHMVSTITAELKTDTHPLAVLFGSLPAGSITGTPKKRAVEIIAELEKTPRGAYCGTMGYMNFDGSGQWNVLIRTLQSNTTAAGETDVSLWAGGGITIASDCAAEYQECLDKVGNLLTVLSRD